MKSKQFRITLKGYTISRILEAMEETNTYSVNHFIRDSIVLRLLDLERKRAQKESFETGTWDTNTKNMDYKCGKDGEVANG